MTTNGRVLTSGTGAECTDPHVPAYVPNGGMRLPPWVFDGEALADRVCRLKFERAREMGDVFPEAPIGGNSAIHAQGRDQTEALTTLKVARQLGVWFRWFPTGARSAS